MFFVKSMGLIQVFSLDQPVIFLVDFGPKEAPYGIIGVVSNESCHQHHRNQKTYVERIAIHGGHCTGCKQKRVTRQKGRYYQSGLTKYDDKKDGICPVLIIGYNFCKVPVNMQDEVNEKANEIGHVV